jgi:hypothetical protein
VKMPQAKRSVKQRAVVSKRGAAASAARRLSDVPIRVDKSLIIPIDAGTLKITGEQRSERK